MWLTNISIIIRNHWLANGKKSQVQNKQWAFTTFCGFIIGIMITCLFFPLTPNSMNSFTVSKSYKENKNVSPECSTTSKQIKTTQNTFFLCLSVLTGWGPDSWESKVWGCQNYFCLSLIITHPEEHVVYRLLPGLQCEGLRFLGETASPSSKICSSALSEYFSFLLSIKCKINRSFPW